MIEKGRGTLENFRTYGVKKGPERIAKEIVNIRWNDPKPQRLERCKILQICQKIGKPMATIERWLKSISVEDEIIADHLKIPKEERIADKILARLSTIEDKELQHRTYTKIEKYNIEAKNNQIHLNGQVFTE